MRITSLASYIKNRAMITSMFDPEKKDDFEKRMKQCVFSKIRRKKNEIKKNRWISVWTRERESI